jgi:hypothetical protein
VANILEIEKDEACMVQNGDKIGAAATGNLRNGKWPHLFQLSMQRSLKAFCPDN